MRLRIHWGWSLFVIGMLAVLAQDWGWPSAARALPSGGQVAGGTAGIQTNGTTMTIQQQSTNALLNWQGFSIGAKETVQFLQPSATSLAVNRVLGGDPSVILGNLLANGRVFLLNPNGVVFGPGSVVNVGGLLATTLSLKSYDLDKGQFTFAQDPTKAFAAVVNQGTLRATDHGFVVLTAPGVVNEGLIVAKFGHVGLGAGTQMAVDFRGDDLIRYAVDSKVMGQVTDPSGRPLSAAVTNAGRIEADGGTVLLTAHASSAVVSSVINQTGVIHARRLESQGGEIMLKGGDEGAVLVAGTMDASGTAKGGIIDVRGEKVGLTSTAKLDVSGETGGGTITVGGGFQGKDGGPNAQQTVVQPGAVLRANAKGQGDGGTVIVWADGSTKFGGDASARGGLNGGNGGFAEVSGKESLLFQGTVDLRAPLGQTGTLLLDPKFITIQAGGSNFAPPYGFADNAAGSVTILDTGAGSLSNAINLATVILQANTDITFGAGANVSASSLSNGLTLQAGRSIIFNANSHLTLNGGSFSTTINDNGAQTANRDTGPAQFLMNGGSQILTSGGNVTITHQSKVGGLSGEVKIGNSTGVATISTGSGSVDITGTGQSGISATSGIIISDGSVIQTTSGNIQLLGTGGAGLQSNLGVRLEGTGTMLSTTTGAITITGTGGGSGIQGNPGVSIRDGAKILSTGTSGAQAITINGFGGAGISSNEGVFICCTGTQISSAGAAINIHGEGGGTGSNSEGIEISNGVSITSTGVTGHIALSGVGADQSEGINTSGLGVSTIGGPSTQGSITLQARSTSPTAPDSIILGSLTIQSTGNLVLQPLNQADSIGINGGAGTFNLSNTEVASFTPGFGLITIGLPTGTGLVSVNGLSRPESVVIQSGGAGGGAINVTAPITLSNPTSFLQLLAGQRVLIDNGANLTTNNGAMTITGNAGGGATGNFIGVDVNGATLTTTGGAITLTGKGGTAGSNNHGIHLRNGADIVTTSGTINLTGTGGNDGSAGVRAEGASTVSSVTSNINITGTGGTSGVNNYGILLRNGSQVSTNSGLISLTGTGGNSSGGGSVGIHFEDAGTVTSNSGPIDIFGIGGNGGGTGNRGVDILVTGTIISSTSGTIDIHGVGGANSSFSYGVVMAQGRVTSGGDISVAGQGGAGGLTDIATLGVLVTNAAQIEGTGASRVTVTGVGGSGTATSATNGEVGVFMHGQNGTFIRTANGDLTIDGTGSGTGIGGQGVILRAGALVDATGTGNVIVSGAGSFTGSANSNGIQLIETGTTVRSNAGNITMTGNAHGALDSTNNIGTAIASGSVVQKSGAGGSVNIVGTGGDGGGGVNNFGVALLSAPTLILANNGAIIITGTGGTGGAAGVTAQGGFVVGAPGIPCASCAPSANINAVGSGTITINSTP